MFELEHNQPLEFRVDQQPGETLKVVFFVVTEGARRPFRLSYVIDGGHLAKRSAGFFRNNTAARGVLDGVTGVAGAGHLWESVVSGKRAETADGIGRADLRIGDDMQAGRRSIRVQLLGERPSQRSFVRAVVVGQGPAPKSGQFALRSAEPF